MNDYKGNKVSNGLRTLNEMVLNHKKRVQEMEQVLVDYALEHNLELYMGEYGIDGRQLVTWEASDDNAPYNPEGRQRGEWLYSSETC